MVVAAADCLNNYGRGGSGSGDITGCIFKYMGKGEVVYSNIHISAHVSVHIIAYIQFNMKSKACKIKFTRIYTCTINFPYIQYFMAAKINFTGKLILAALVSFQ
jgi:hypothetical protein